MPAAATSMVGGMHPGSLSGRASLKPGICRLGMESCLMWRNVSSPDWPSPLGPSFVPPRQQDAGNLSTWDGIVLDVEECFESGLAKPFGALLRAAKAAGLRTMVTTSHSAPYKCDDAKALMQSFFASDDCDYISPQLYASGNEKNVSFEPTSG